MTIVHIVLATFKPDVGQDVIESVRLTFQLSLYIHPWLGI